MKLTAKLALSQVKTQKNRSVMTILGIALSSAMLTAVCGFGASVKQTIDSVIQYDYNNKTYNAALLTVGIVLGAIIIACSVIVVSNAFRVSAGERIKQFGMLKSVGATKRQITSSVVYEGIFLSAIGIPLGVAIGLFVELVGVSVITSLLQKLVKDDMANLDFEPVLRFAAPYWMFIVAALTSFLTVMLSAWLPARKAAKIPAIEAIRQTEEVKLHPKQVKIGKLTQKLFGFEGVLAAKSIKRSRRNYRATTVSLTISVIMIIAAGSFGSTMKDVTQLLFPNIDATNLISYYSPEEPSTKTDVENITGKLSEQGSVFMIGKEKLESGTLIMLDTPHYIELCKKYRKTAGSNITVTADDSALPNEIRFLLDGEMSPYIIVSECNPTDVCWFGKSDNAEAFSELGTSILMDNFGEDAGRRQTQSMDIKMVTDNIKMTIDTVMFFVYGFVVMLTLIAVTGAVSTISTNIRSRKKEFAVLESVGMTKDGLRRMLRLESILCSFRALIFGLPIGLLISYGLFKTMGIEGTAMEGNLRFLFPWLYVVACVAGLFIITWLTMRFAVSRLKGGNIINAIRGDGV